MGVFWSNAFEDPIEYNAREFQKLRATLIFLMQGLAPEAVLDLVLEDREILDMCKENSILRQSCILGALRRFHKEKFNSEGAHNRTADYVVILDTLIKIQEQEDEKVLKESESKKLFGFIPIPSFLTWSYWFQSSNKEEKENENEEKKE